MGVLPGRSVNTSRLVASAGRLYTRTSPLRDQASGNSAVAGASRATKGAGGSLSSAGIEYRLRSFANVIRLPSCDQT